MLEHHDLAAVESGEMALLMVNELLKALFGDEAGHRVQLSLQTIQVAGTIWKVANGGRTRIPVECPECGARSELRLTADHEDATLTCEAGHVSRHWHLTADTVRRAIDARVRIRRARDDLDVPMSDDD